ncbi:hypothetical protein J3R30DRAFT_3409741 [Lentinula aciculospora]|uniref:Uncharacterized protein n=1 Tax=Lentinula aciculospora TaxID=153920 RepID=A0A9W8ZX03_9AGAR|nr:hypothetical protein J3R30DRAFT_3409741 [Lentinula aciculospora]
MSDLHLDQQLPSYSPSRLPPSYSLHSLDGEETLAQTCRFNSSSHSTGTFTKQYGDITVVLSEQDEDADVPSYGRQGLVAGSIIFDSSLKTEDIVAVILKVEGRIKLNISGANAVSKTVKTVDEQYELWSRQALNLSTVSTCPRLLPFSTVLPPTFKDGDREFSLPPSYEVNFTGIPGLYVKCMYAIRAIVKTHGSLWDHKQTVSTPFIYRPRKRPPQPTVTSAFFSSIKVSPEEWFQTTSMLQAKTSTKLESINASLFLPAVRSFGLRDIIPYHIQLTGPIPSLKILYSHLRYETESSSSSTWSRSALTMSVSLCRQVRVDVKGQAVWKSSIIGNGTLTALPPSIELEPSLSLSSQEMSLDWEGEIRCRNDIRVGHFDAGKIAASDFVVFSITPRPNSGSFNSLRMIVPISLVTDTWVEH